MSTRREAHLDKVKAQIDEWDARLDVYKAKAAKAGAGAKIEMHEAVDEIRKLQADAVKHYEGLKKTSSSATTDVKSSIDDAWRSMTTKVETAWRKLT